MKGYELESYSEQTFESIKRIDEYGQEYWLARELARVLQYADWRNFENILFKAMDACKNSGISIEDNFGEVTSFTKMNTGSVRKIGDYALKNKLKLLEAWIVIHRDDLEANWKLLSGGEQFFRIDPLK